MSNLFVSPALPGHIMLHSVRNSGEETVNAYIFQMIWRQLNNSLGNVGSKAVSQSPLCC